MNKIKKYNFTTGNVSLSITAMSLAGTILLANFAGCSKVSTITESNNFSSPNSSYSLQSVGKTTNPMTSEKSYVYDISWTEEDTKLFSLYIQSLTDNAMDLSLYIYCYGFSAEMDILIANYINATRGTDYELIPKDIYYKWFKSLTYIGSINFKDKYESFSKRFLNYNRAPRNSFNNKLIMIYLIKNKIPFGTMVPIENLKALSIDNMYSYKLYSMIDSNPKVGNDGGKVNKYMLYELLLSYNISIENLCGSKDAECFTLNPTDSPELCKMCDEYFDKFYGSGVLKMGVVPTEETYSKMFNGEKPIEPADIQNFVYNPANCKTEYLGDNLTDNAIDELNLGEWTTYIKDSGYTYTYKFNDDFTGVLTTKHNITNVNTGKKEEQINEITFTYKISKGILVLQNSVGNSDYLFINHPKDNNKIIINGVTYEGTSNVRTR